MERPLNVGIMSEQTIRFVLNGNYLFNGKQYTGEYTATAEQGQIRFDGQLYDELYFQGGENFVLRGVTIGVNFHWQRREDQTFKGNLKIIAGHDRVLNKEAGLIAINELDVEDYLASVISSEMAATSSMELLKAHAVISRSWLLHPIVSRRRSSESLTSSTSSTSLESSESLNSLQTLHIRWYERDAHSLFDVCADDHCQRYQGITKQTSENVQKAIDETRGMVLRSTDNGEVCDARFYKSCGGATELFENCWADEHYPYLEAVRDSANDTLPDLTQESEAEQWIRTAPPAFCNTSDRRILQQVLNNYDQETQDFYRWKVEYTQEELSETVRERSGIDFGLIEELIPIKRGPSARIYELKIVGTKRTMTVGKELEIRKWLSHSHLYSSAFVVDKNEGRCTEGGKTAALKEERQVTTFTLTGAGWGHGVGLCQIGAAVMADKGYDYRQILQHYFPNTRLERLGSLRS